MSRKPDTTDSQLVAAFKEATRISDQMKLDGASREDRDAYIATVLQEAWPKGRSQPWVYYCETCSDTGWAPKTCVNRSCGRPFALPKQSADDWTGRGRCAPNHSYAVACTCAKGEAQRRGLLKQRRPDDAMEVAAKVTKPTRVGR